MSNMGMITGKSGKWEGLPKMRGCSNKKGGMGSFWGKKLSKIKNSL